MAARREHHPAQHHYSWAGGDPQAVRRTYRPAQCLKYMVRNGRDTKVLGLWSQIWRGEGDEWVACLPRGTKAISGSQLLPRSTSGSLALLHGLWWCLLSLVTTKGIEDRATPSWPLTSLAAALRRTGPAPHQLGHSRDALHSTWVAQ